MEKIPHLVQYQGSKRKIAPEIIKYFPEDIVTLYEPFAGTCAMSILAAKKGLCRDFVENDINEPLMELMQTCVDDPDGLSSSYQDIWAGQFEPEENNVEYFYKIRKEFNEGKTDPARMLFLLARVVKGAIRYNSEGMMNQSCDKRRYGTKPVVIEKNAHAISNLLKGKTRFYSVDYRDILKMVGPNDLVYMDPPYQGTSNKKETRDNRYISGVDYDEFVAALEYLNKRGIRYIVSYDGQTGEKVIGKRLPEHLNLTHIFINAGTSAQATLSGKAETTYESLYLSPGLLDSNTNQQLSLYD